MRGLNWRRWGIGAVAVSLVGMLFMGCSRHGRHGMWGHYGQAWENPEKARERAENAVEWVLGRVDASDEQEDKVKGIVGGSIEEMIELGKQHREHRQQMVALLEQPDIDAAALESLRREEIKLADAASVKMMEVLTEAAEVLSPEQRRELLESMHRF